MAGGGQDGPGFPTSGLIAALVLLASAIVVHQLPYIVSRPPLSDPAWRPFVARQDVEARLWQDPFAAITQHIEQTQSRAGDPEADQAETERHSVGKMKEALARDLGGTVVMPVIVPGSRHGEDIEGRRRTRYAVAAALSKLGFTPDDAEHIGFFRPETRAKAPNLPRIVPWELLKAPVDPAGKSAAREALVLWLDATAFGAKPLAKLERLLDDLGLCQRESSEKPRVVMIGPASSDDLAAMVNEQVRAPGGCLSGTAIYSPWATAILRGQEEPAVTLRKSGIQFVRMIGTDERLVPALKHELDLRGVKAPLATRTIAVVYELDTSYGRDIVESIQQGLCGAGGDTADCVYPLGYLRGIDGKIPKRPEPKEGTSAGKPADGKPEAPPSDDLERAEGDSQFDYLRRLAARMRSENDRLVRGGKSGIRVVGVFGSDLYDKLLVLQAVRQEFPTAVFFTTDLDARYMHPREFQWTRNLLVVSSHGLQLREQIQEHLPPFRNNYQTATFLAVTVGVINSKLTGQAPVSESRITQWLKEPRVYEIGRTEAVDVSGGPSGQVETGDGPCKVLADCPGIYPEPVLFDRPYEKTLLAWAFGGLFAIILIPLVSSEVRANLTATARWVDRHPESTAHILLVAISVIALFMLGVIAEGRRSEPFRFLEGVSVWPTEILRTVALLVAIFGIVMTEIRRKRTDEALRSRYFERFEPPQNDGPRVGELAREARAAVRFASKVLVQPSVLKNLRAHDVAPTWLRVFAGKPDRSYFLLPFEVVDTVKLWADHNYQNTPVARWTRILVCSILFYAFGAAIMAALGPPVTPARGDFAWWVDRIVVVSTVGALIVLIFCVGDTIRLCDKFAYFLGAPYVPNRWPKEAREVFGIAPVDKESPLDHWIDVRFLAEWTGRIGGIIYYPFVVLLLVIVARSSIFDNWDMPPSLVMVLLLSFAMASATVFILRRAAERLRRLSLDHLVQDLVVKEGAAVDEAKVRQLRTVLDEVRQLREGAFAPITSQPIVRAALLPLSGAGGIALLEYFFLRR